MQLMKSLNSLFMSTVAITSISAFTVQNAAIISSKQRNVFQSQELINVKSSSALPLMKTYSNMLDLHPVSTKTITSSIVFAISDVLAQKMCKEEKLDLKRTIYSLVVGSVYGTACHIWYGAMFQLLPSTTIMSNMTKAILGQLVFGPLFICVFFASALLQSGDFSVKNLKRKVKTDFPATWASAMGFWPLMELISYSIISVKFIPLFINFCSFIWSLYISVMSNRQQTPRLQTA